MGSDSAGPTGPQRALRGGPTEAALLLYLLRLLGLQVQGGLPPSPVLPPPSLLLLSPRKEVVSCPLATLPTGSSASQKEIHPDWGLTWRALIFNAFLDLPLRPAGLCSLACLDSCSPTRSQPRPKRRLADTPLPPQPSSLALVSSGLPCARGQASPASGLGTSLPRASLLAFRSLQTQLSLSCEFCPCPPSSILFL